MTKKAKTDVYQIITDRILEQLDKGVVPWHKPWRSSDAMPKNLVSKKAYRGMNIFMLLMADYQSPYWVTYNQAKKLDGNVKKGERGMPVVFWKFIKKDKVDEETGEVKHSAFPICRYYTVFNVEQTEGIDESKIPALAEKEEHDAIAECEMVVDGMQNRPEIKNVGGRACYTPMTDTVRVPELGYFEGAEEYYSTMFHELVHATGHQSRLNRKGVADTVAAYGDDTYSQEELVAEMGAAMLCGVTGIENATIENSAAYIEGWRKKIGDDKKLVIMAAAQGQKAADYILGTTFEDIEK